MRGNAGHCGGQNVSPALAGRAPRRDQELRPHHGPISRCGQRAGRNHWIMYDHSPSAKSRGCGGERDKPGKFVSGNSATRRPIHGACAGAGAKGATIEFCLCVISGSATLKPALTKAEFVEADQGVTTSLTRAIGALQRAGPTGKALLSAK